MQGSIVGMWLTGELLEENPPPYIATFFAKTHKQTDLESNKSLHIDRLSTRKIISSFHGTPPVGQSTLVKKVSPSHSDTPHSVGFPWTSDQPVAETST